MPQPRRQAFISDYYDPAKTTHPPLEVDTSLLPKDWHVYHASGTNPGGPWDEYGVSGGPFKIVIVPITPTATTRP